MSIPQQIHWIQLNHLLLITMYNLSLPKLHANYYRLPATVQLRAAHEPMFTVWCLAANSLQVLYCTWLERYILGPFTGIWTCVERGGVCALEGYGHGGVHPAPRLPMM